MIDPAATVVLMILLLILVWLGYVIGRVTSPEEKMVNGLILYFQGKIPGTSTYIKTETTLPITDYHYRPALHACYICRQPMTIMHTRYASSPWYLYACRNCHPEVEVK